MTHRSSPESSIEISADVNLVSMHELFEHTQDVFNLIAKRAYEIFENRGHVHGNDREDWFLAESELLTPVKFHLSESGERLTARAEVPGFHRQEIKVSLEPRRLSISGKTEPLENQESEKHPHSHRHAQLMFCVIDLPCEVDLSKAKASFNDGRLEVVMPRAAPAKSVRVETQPGLSGENDTFVPEAAGIEAGRSPQPVAGANEPFVKAHAASSRK
jgi:HSP20 family molecular chaperone IbpA